ncbi:MAG: hypothetical protein ACOYO1_08085 [Bacteroidales bacterium]
MSKISKYILQSLLILISLPVVGQEISIVTKIDTNSILIGDQINLKFSITSPISYKVVFPILIDSLSDKIEIVNQSKIDTVYSKDKSEFTLNQSILITSFDSGLYKIPSFAFQYQTKNGTSINTIFSDSLFLMVNNVAVDTNLAIKDIKAPLETPITLKELLPFIGLGLGIIAIVILTIYLIRRYSRKKGAIIVPQKPKIPPYKKALQDLESLRIKKLWQNDKIKEYHSELTEILRLYLENQFNVQAMEMTSDEIIEAFKNIKNDEVLISKLNQILTLADLVKFAKQLPLPDQHDLSLNNAIYIVKLTYTDTNNDVTLTDTTDNLKQN